MEKKKIIWIVALIVLLLVSEFGMSKFAMSSNSYKGITKTLDENRNSVLKLTGAATAASAAISLIPGDIGTPIAEKLADLSFYFLIVLCAIFLEKYLLTTIGFLSFRILIPVGLAILIWTIVSYEEKRRKIAIKLIAFALAIYCVVPGSIFISNMIEKTYHENVETTVQDAEAAIDQIDSSTQQDSKGNWLSSLVDNAENSVKKITVKMQTILNKMIESLAVMIVTTCLIPLFVLWVALWLVKMLTGLDYSLPKTNNLLHKKKQLSDVNVEE